MNKKEIAQNFLNLAATGKAKEAFEKYVAHNFVHHNQYTKSGREGLMEGMNAAHSMSPHKGIRFHHVYEDGQTVISHSEVIRGNPADSNFAVVHILRFEGEKIAEMWDLGQMIEKNMVNEDGIF